jgi:hypothetical protein
LAGLKLCSWRKIVGDGSDYAVGLDIKPIVISDIHYTNTA